ncbi:MAG: HIT domain-containing protein [Myxococcales bacterium]|nr:HIT domain-containing protein [Myxococcales bacterium]
MLAQPQEPVRARIPRAETIPHCPFCSNDEILVVLYESESVRVFPDIRPITGGHFLIATSTHYQSMEDQEPINYWRVRVIQQEVARRVRAGFGGVASSYEHGRSAICRFHAADRGDTHAHVHVLPTRIDVFERSQTAERSDSRPAPRQLQGTDRYIYQNLDHRGDSWGWRPRSVPRHFLRMALQAGLEEQGKPFISLGAPHTDHVATVQHNAATYCEHRDTSSRVITVDGPTPELRSACAIELARAWGAEVIDEPMLLRRVGSGVDPGDEARLRERLRELGRAMDQGSPSGTLDGDRSGLARGGAAVLAEPRAEAREPVLAELGWLREAVQELVQQRAEARPIVMTGSPTAGHEIQLWFGSQGPELDRRVRFDAEHLEPREAALVALEALRARTT